MKTYLRVLLDENLPVKTPIIILKINALSNRYEDLIPFVPAIKDELMNIKNDFENGIKSSFLEMRILK